MEKIEEKKEEQKEEKKEEVKTTFYEREKSADNFMKNLKAMQELKWDEFIEELKIAPEKIVKIDNKIGYKALKNPLVCVFIGMSTRKMIDALRRIPKTIQYICVIEPDISIFKHLVATEDISDLLLDPYIDFVVGKQGELVIPELYTRFTKPMPTGVTRTTIIQNMEMLLDPFVYTKDNHEEGMKYVDLTHQAVKQLKLSMGCPDDQFRRLELMMLNKDTMCKAWNISGLWNQFKDIPAFILGGGPSLQTFIEEYKVNPSLKNGIIIAVDAVLRKLLDNGIKPHMVVRCERKLTSIFKGIKKEDTKGIYYCAYPWTAPEFFDLFEEHFYLFRQNGVCRFTEIKHGFVDGGVSSGNAALEIAFNLGCEEIYLSGIDMCMKDGETHIDGTEVEFDIEKSRKLWTKVPTNDGKTETTIPVWERCRKEYTQAIQKHNGKGNKARVINTSPTGAVIPLAEFKPINGISVTEKDVLERIEKFRAKLPQEQIDRFNTIISEAKEKFSGYIETIKTAKELTEDAKRTAEREIEKIILLCKTSARDDYEFILLLRNNKANLNKLWGGVTGQIDLNFKGKLYREQLFTTLVFDVLQGQLFHYENTVNGLVNLLEYEDHRHYVYYTTTKEFIAQVEHYLGKFVALFS